mmetsp:Transcript_19697/g.64048  ORF Transcript_19697/g.64048 Transcript_19697/m.64048 type:complete len:371 (+) Transcript_19697:142-1254(+)
MSAETKSMKMLKRRSPRRKTHREWLSMKAESLSLRMALSCAAAAYCARFHWSRARAPRVRCGSSGSGRSTATPYRNSSRSTAPLRSRSAVSRKAFCALVSHSTPSARISSESSDRSSVPSPSTSTALKASCSAVITAISKLPLTHSGIGCVSSAARSSMFTAAEPRSPPTTAGAFPLPKREFLRSERTGIFPPRDISWSDASSSRARRSSSATFSALVPRINFFRRDLTLGVVDPLCRTDDGADADADVGSWSDLLPTPGFGGTRLTCTFFGSAAPSFPPPPPPPVEEAPAPPSAVRAPDAPGFDAGAGACMSIPGPDSSSESSSSPPSGSTAPEAAPPEPPPARMSAAPPDTMSRHVGTRMAWSLSFTS